MPTLPAELLPLIVNFQPLFSKSVWENAQTLLVGAILAIGNRTVTACLRVTGNGQDKRFQNYHRVLNRARWSALQAARVLPGRLALSKYIGGRRIASRKVVAPGAEQVYGRRRSQV